VRTKQSEFELGKNVLEYNDVEKGEEVWGDKVKVLLKEWAVSERGRGEVERLRAKEDDGRRNSGGKWNGGKWRR